MQLFLGADHGGFHLKQSLIDWLQNSYTISDQGAYDENSSHYPTFAIKVAEAVRSNESTRGILICTTGIGMCITANKIKGIRAALIHNEKLSRSARQHNDINVLCLAGTLRFERAKKIVLSFLQTPFHNQERHRERLKMIHALERA